MSRRFAGCRARPAAPATDTPGTGPDTVRYGRLVLYGLGVAVVAATVANLFGSSGVRLAVMLVSGLSAAAAAVLGMRIHRVTDRTPWLIVIAALLMLSVVNAAWFASVGLGTAPSPRLALVAPFQIGGYLGLLTASIMVVLRHASHDTGGVIDAAIVGMACAAPLWEWLLRPGLRHTGESQSAQMIVLVQTLVLLGVLGSLLRIARSTEQARVPLNLMFAALGSTVAGIIVAHALPGYPGVDLPGLDTLLFSVGYLCLGSAGLHPGVVALMRPVIRPHGEKPSLRLGYLGTALAVIPVVGGLPQMFGELPDGMLLSVGPLFMVPLVLKRIGQLLAQRAADQERLIHQAHHDELTGLINRRRLFTLIEDAAAQHVQGLLPGVALLYCDLDDFKPVNDRFGHDAGDEVLRVVAERLSRSMRSGDVVGRVGGDEFMVLCPGAGTDVAQSVGMRVEELLAAPIPWQGHELHVGVTVGVAVWAGGAGSVADDLAAIADDLAAIADREMYARKRHRKGPSEQPPSQPVTP